MEIRVDANVEKFLTTLEKQTLAKVLRTVDLLEKFGHRLGMPHSKKMSKEIFEIRIRGKREIRIFYCFHENIIYLLHGFVKKSQKTPKKDLRVAEDRYNDLTMI